MYVRLKTAGYQSALMVPTEILAEQHAESLIQLFGNTMNVALLTGSVKGKKKTTSFRAIRKWNYRLFDWYTRLDSR